MADVFRAVHETTKNEVALKILPREYAMDGKHLARFKREIEQSSRLEHPNLCRVYDWGEEDGIHFYCMEIIEGLDLEEYIQKREKISLEEVFSIIKDLCKGLVYLHEKNVIHRDIKPTNIFFKPDGQTILADFGLLKDITENDITGDNTRLGTPTYMSPEQFKGSKIDSKTDIYQLGIVFYKLLTGVTPFEGDSFFSLGIKVMTKRVPPPQKYNPDIPDEVQRIILKACEKKPEDRYQTAKDLANDVNRYFVQREMVEGRQGSASASPADTAAAEKPSEPQERGRQETGRQRAIQEKTEPARAATKPTETKPPKEKKAKKVRLKKRPKQRRPQLRQSAGSYDPYGMNSLQGSGVWSADINTSGVRSSGVRGGKTSSVIIKPVTAYSDGGGKRRDVHPNETFGLLVLAPIVGALTYPLVATHLGFVIGLVSAIVAGVFIALGCRYVALPFVPFTTVLKTVVLLWAFAVVGHNLLEMGNKDILFGFTAEDSVGFLAIIAVAVGLSYIAASEVLDKSHKTAIFLIGFYSLFWVIGWLGKSFSFRELVLGEYHAIEDGFISGLLRPLSATFYVLCYLFFPVVDLVALVDVISLMTRKELERAVTVFISFLIMFVTLFFMLHFEKSIVSEYLRHNPL